MTDWLAGPVDEFTEGRRKVFVAGEHEIVLLRVQGSLHAYENQCLHMGGPVGEGIILGKVEAVLDAQKRLVEERFSETELHLICPWHGWEYDVATGVCAGDRRLKLKQFPVVEREGHVYVVA
jgi:nitrite reductase (NADH) small subunit